MTYPRQTPYIKPKPIAIDPAGCGCTECITHEYVPLEEATWNDYRRMKKGKAANNTGLTRKEVRRYLEAHGTMPV